MLHREINRHTGGSSNTEYVRIPVSTTIGQEGQGCRGLKGYPTARTTRLGQANRQADCGSRARRGTRKGSQGCSREGWMTLTGGLGRAHRGSRGPRFDSELGTASRAKSGGSIDTDNLGSLLVGHTQEAEFVDFRVGGTRSRGGNVGVIKEWDG